MWVIVLWMGVCGGGCGLCENVFDSINVVHTACTNMWMYMVRSYYPNLEYRKLQQSREEVIMKG